MRCLHCFRQTDNLLLISYAKRLNRELFSSTMKSYLTVSSFIIFIPSSLKMVLANTLLSTNLKRFQNELAKRKFYLRQL